MFFRAKTVSCEPWQADGAWRLLVKLLVVMVAVSLASNVARAEVLAPFKDHLFAYPDMLEQRDGGAYRIIDYRERRDIDFRDAVPERRVKRKYTDLSVRRYERDLVFEASTGTVRFGTVGQLDTAKLMTVFIHGRGGDRTLGMNDLRFGGNFNRIKNLMLRNGGFYLVPDADDFSASRVAAISELLASHLEVASDARLVVACGSAGGAVCHGIANNDALVGRLAGIAFMGSFANPDYLASRAAQAKVPVYIAHGSADSIFNVTDLEGFYTSLRDARIPVRMARFETGGHGTPIRMTDWRLMINWMVAN